MSGSIAPASAPDTIDPEIPRSSGPRGPSHVKPSHRSEAPPVTGESLVAMAITLIERDGLSELTMDKVSSHLRADPSEVDQIYPDREQLLDAVVDAVIDELYADPDVQPASREWQEYLERVAFGVRRIALAHPQVFPLIATRPPAAPWLQPPLRSLRWMEVFLETLHQAGFSDRAAVAAYRAFASFLLGHLLLEVSALGVDIAPVDESAPRPARRHDLDDYPRLHCMQSELTRNHFEDEFAESLESLLDRLHAAGKK